jgi:hypothetical protein
MALTKVTSDVVDETIIKTVTLSQTDYDAIVTKSPTTIYITTA